MVTKPAALVATWGCSALVPGLRMDEDKVEERGRASDGNRFVGFWEAMVRAELRADPTLLDDRG